MKKTLNILGFLLFGLFSSSNEVYGGDKTVLEVKKTLADYMTPRAEEAIRTSQGTLVCSIITWSKEKRSDAQAIVIDAEKGLILSVAHGVSKYPDVAFGSGTKYSFIFDGITYSVEFKDISPSSDLAIFKITDTDKDLSKLKSVKFAKEINLFDEYYSLRQTVNYGKNGFTVAGKIPWKANLVSIDKDETISTNKPSKDTIVNIENLIFDRAVIFGFSGSGIFNKDGEVIGMMQSSLEPGGFSKGLSAVTIVPLVGDYKSLEAYRENQRKLEEESSKSTPPSNKTTDQK